VLAKYVYLFDLPALAQQPDRADQKSQVVSTDIQYKLARRWSVGGTVARRVGEIRTQRDSGQWFDSDMNLAVGQLKYHLLNSVDAVAEYRTLWSHDGGDVRKGVLVGAYKHLRRYFLFGVGYNFTDFSDDLTSLDGSAHGWFVNVIGKF
jgi:hypothetical protein